jgi:hypothetical protein
MFDLTVDGPPGRGLRRYVEAVSEALGAGPESCCCMVEIPASGYVAVDERLPNYPDRDFALVWDECQGWAAVIETSSGEDFIVLSYLGQEVLPEPGMVARFVRDLRAGEYPGQPDPPMLRRPHTADSLAADLARFHVPLAG